MFKNRSRHTQPHTHHSILTYCVYACTSLSDNTQTIICYAGKLLFTHSHTLLPLSLGLLLSSLFLSFRRKVSAHQETTGLSERERGRGEEWWSTAYAQPVKVENTISMLVWHLISDCRHNGILAKVFLFLFIWIHKSQPTYDQHWNLCSVASLCDYLNCFSTSLSLKFYSVSVR